MTGALRILVATDKFKGCLGAGEVARDLRTGLAQALPGAEIRLHPVSDGGDGFATELVAHGFTLQTARVSDPLRRPTEAQFAIGQGSAVIEMAASSGLAPLLAHELAPLRADTFGLGELVLAALEQQPERVVIGAGGSATSDGGAGALAALGMAVRASSNTSPEHYGPAALLGLATVDLDALSRVRRRTRFQVATDVTNPLLGRRGAAAVFGPQKGATSSDLDVIERALTHWANLLEDVTGRRLRDAPRAGAAGGMAFGLSAALGADLVDGIDTFAELSGLRDAVSWADLVITGEGSLDAQTTGGKAPVGVLRYARAASVPCWAVVGRSTLTIDGVRRLGFVDHLALTDYANDERSSIEHASRWLQEAGRHLGEHVTSGRLHAPLNRSGGLTG
ncbi:glycerate kinase [Pseudactinotalea sp.]|uniref:glycerate kinase n=1 Tax=Pseudactinotalea sp. TaxID=1926260 RepID=UPI003B3AE33C